VLYTFGNSAVTNDAGNPVAGLIFDSAGNLYGTTEFGGTADFGTVFELTPGSQGTWTESVLYSFTDETDGAYPFASVTIDAAGHLYGTGSQGGDVSCNNGGYQPWGCGVVFKLTHNSDGTWSESVLHSFVQYDGAFPMGNVIFDSAGNLYGTTQNGPGINCGFGCGTAFKMTPGGNGTWTLKTVYTFAGGPDGETPLGGLVQGADGHFYGTTKGGGNTTNCSYGCGTVFELTPTSGPVWKEKIIHNFSGSSTAPYGVDGDAPITNVIFDQAGNLYGTTPVGGSVASAATCYAVSRCGGAVFKLSKNASGQWIGSLLYAFGASGDGLNPQGGLVADSAGNLYGTTPYGGAHGLGSVYELIAQSSGGYKERVIYSFAGGTDGFYPSGTLISDVAGNLYGATFYGGNTLCPYNIGCGIIFELSPGAGGKWTEAILYRFTGGTDGEFPGSPLTFDSAGNLYGVGSGSNNAGLGTVFQLSPSGGSWTFSLLHAFTGLDGAFPGGGLIFDASGNLYGVAEGGAKGNGVVYELSPGSGGWTQTLLHTFQGKTDGGYPNPLAIDQHGHLFGTAAIGGSTTNCSSGCGVVFELVQIAGQWQQKAIYSFAGGNDGQLPLARVIFDSVGNLYGSTYYGGGPYAGGTVYKLTPSAGTWSESVVYALGEVLFDAYRPGPLLLDSTNHLFGTAGGGFDFNGTVFEITLNQAAESSQQRPITPSQLRPRQMPPGPPFYALTKAATSGKGGN
jgi:uncharacterized repeat protein (TIGR03803 family)